MANVPVPAQRSPRKPRVLLVAVLGVVAMVLTSAGGATAAVVSYDVWTDALAEDFAAAEEAHRAGDCDAAAEGYRRVADQLDWTGDDLVEPARAAAAECEAFLAVARRAEAGEWQGAIDGYETFVADYPESLLGDAVTDARAAAELGLADQLGDEAVDAGEVDAYDAAMEQYVVVLTDYADTPSAGEVEPGLSRLADAAVEVAEGGAHCDALPLLRDLAARTEPELSAVSGRANDALPRSLYECGVEREGAGDLREAVELLEDLGELFPDDPLVGEAEPVLIGALIDRDRDAAQDLGAPLELARPGGSGALVLFINGAPLPMEILYTGPETGRVTLDACDTCAPVIPPDDGESTCLSSSSVEALEVTGGDYRVLVRFLGGGEASEGFASDWRLEEGVDYDAGCFFIGS